jgi:hypothetical protein
MQRVESDAAKAKLDYGAEPYIPHHVSHSPGWLKTTSFA